MYLLECRQINKAFDAVPVVQGVTLDVRAGQFVTLLGPSGCGKTTTLRLIAGFEQPDSGTISINGRLVAGVGAVVPPEARQVGMVFQEYALFPHLSVADNIAFGVRGSRREKQARVEVLLALVGLSNLGQRMPYELSGGQQQRVALARALAPNPSVVLLDEPFSNLDAALRQQMRAEVRAILRQANTTCIFVTHDQEEALSLADRVAVMFEGQIVQFDTPRAVYHHPASRAVAQFIGEANWLPAQADGRSAACVFGHVPLAEPAHGIVDLLLRPEMLRLTPYAEEHGGELAAEVLWTEFYGYYQRVGLRLPSGTTLVARADGNQSFALGERVFAAISGAPLAFA